MKRWNLLQYILHPLDVLSILFAFQSSYLINYWSEGGLFLSDIDIMQLFLWVLPIWLTILALIKVTGIPTKRHKVLFFLYLQAAVSIFFILTFLDLFLILDTIPRLFLAEVSIFGFLFMFFGRIIVYQTMRALGVKGYNHINTIIVADDNSLGFIENLISRKELGYNIVVIFTESELIRSKFENVAIILPGMFLGILNDLIKVDFIDEVLYLKEEPDAKDFREVLRSCEDLGVSLRLKAKESKIKLSSATTKDIANGRFLSFDNIPNNSYAIAIKKTMDINIALLMIVVLLPVLVLISLLIKLSSKGPIISIFSKPGWKGQQIKVYRFRTMIEYTDMRNMLYQDGMIITDQEGSDNFTKIGKFLHLSGLDQLPQLFNVLKGEIPIIVIKHPLQAD